MTMPKTVGAKELLRNSLHKEKSPTEERNVFISLL